MHGNYSITNMTDKTMKVQRIWGLKTTTWKDIIVISLFVLVVVFFGAQAARAEDNMGQWDQRDVEIVQCKLDLIERDVQAKVKELGL